MKRLFRMVLVLVLSIGLTACGAKPTAISAIAEQTVSVGSTLTLTPKLIFAEEGLSEEDYQKRIDKLKIVYMSAGSGIASVDENGVVTGGAGGGNAESGGTAAETPTPPPAPPPAPDDG